MMGTSSAKTGNAGYRWVILLINFVVCAFAYSGLTTWSAALNELVDTFHVSKSVASLGASVFMMGYAVGSFVETQISARYGYRTGGLVGLICMVVGIFGVPYAPSFEMVLLFRFLAGLGDSVGRGNQQCGRLVSAGKPRICFRRDRRFPGARNWHRKFCGEWTHEHYRHLAGGV